MIQGTASSAGKSLICAALCRLLARRGYDVAPFKAQNMSLNSYVTSAGGEMGIAQALQAKACGLSAEARMNPILLKPMGQRGSQVILLGKPAGIMDYREYCAKKPEFERSAHEAYAGLAAGRDAMILEGAGSPAEINLASHDIVNMAMARHAGAKVLLVADIDKGGAFAALYGTMALLPTRDQARIAGFILNKFRGDKALLKPGLDEIAQRCGRPFAGVVEMIPDLRLPEEDSASGFAQRLRRQPRPGELDIAVVELAAMSNAADWDCLAAEPGVCVRVVSSGAELGEPHLAIVPGSRNVPAALARLRATGLADALQAYGAKIRSGAPGRIAGICAGLQILGESLSDSEGIEGGGNHACLKLLPLRTSLCAEKKLARQKARIRLGDRLLACEGYEIHHGRITGAAPALIHNAAGEALGYGDERIWGAWLHGIFEADAFRHEFLNQLRAEAGLAPRAGRKWDLSAELDRAADALEAGLDMDFAMSLLAR